MIDSTLSLFAEHDAAAADKGSNGAREAPGAPDASAPPAPRADAAPTSPTTDSRSAHATYVNTLYERHRPTLLGYLLGLLRLRADAEDVLQETYARLLSGVPLDRDEARTVGL